MKEEPPSPEEIRNLYDDFIAQRSVAMEYSLGTREDWEAGEKLIGRILRYALKCRLAELRSEAK
jgi:hypothetical protein